ncbi:hypothetical protein K443DRAFT_675179 [Laccaria amethystina LaAM-08-1]|uniref:Uncharacterized protein n=1 Tax=Laccaria amethystina LaAM-08-1 TaxID=1095629 RepID=A0A0C9XUU7_9AGAR|nr:hypothetical protein K443DRAFT_675179 [Laccaria amethystina LaAM-08-1]
MELCHMHSVTSQTLGATVISENIPLVIYHFCLTLTSEADETPPRQAEIREWDLIHHRSCGYHTPGAMPRPSEA